MILTVCLVVAAVLLLIVVVGCYVASDKVAPVKLNGSRVVITGGSDGLGLVLSTRLAQFGSHIVIIARNQEKLNKALAVVQAATINQQQIIKTISADVSDAEGITAAIKSASDMLGGGIDVLINNAGITRPGRFESVDTTYFQRCMNVNFFGNVNALKAVLPIMKKQRSGRIVSVSSVLGLFGCMGYSAYAPSKAAIISLYETLQQEYYAYNIHFSVATPASIGTESFFEEEQKIKPKETLELEKDDPVLTAEQVAEPIIRSLSGRYNFLISPSGFNSDVMTISCAGWGPASFTEALSQVLFAGPLRLISLFAFNSKAKAISIKHRTE